MLRPYFLVGSELLTELAPVGSILYTGYLDVIGVFNSLVQVRNNVDKAWENIHVLLMQRHDEHRPAHFLELFRKAYA